MTRDAFHRAVSTKVGHERDFATEHSLMRANLLGENLLFFLKRNLDFLHFPRMKEVIKMLRRIFNFSDPANRPTLMKGICFFFTAFALP